MHIMGFAKEGKRHSAPSSSNRSRIRVRLVVGEQSDEFLQKAVTQGSQAPFVENTECQKEPLSTIMIRSSFSSCFLWLVVLEQVIEACDLVSDVYINCKW